MSAKVDQTLGVWAMTFRAQADDLFLILLWGADKFLQPSVWNALRSYEAWLYDNRFRMQFRHLEDKGLIRRRGRARKMVCRLTREGRLSALGGRDPASHWDRPWDGTWRLVLFDLPVGQHALRQRLLKWLRDHWFGFLQQSVWVRPDRVEDLSERLGGLRKDVGLLTLMESRLCAGYHDAAIVKKAWDFTEINDRYETYLKVAGPQLRQVMRSRGIRNQLPPWLQQERLAWERAVRIDPLLPSPLLPPRYLGRKALAARQRAQKTVLAHLA